MKAFDELQGVIPALVTPLKPDFTIDEEGIHRLVNRTIDGGVSGVLALGTTGEGPMFTAEKRYKIISTVAEVTGGRVPVMAGIYGLGTELALAEIESAAQAGADYALVVPPFYMPIPGAQVVSFYSELATRSPIPVLIYNLPQLTSVTMSVAQVSELASHENIAGVKDSAGDMTWFSHVLNKCQSKTFKVFQGRTTLWFASALLGADGVIDPSANIVPTWDVELLSCVQRGDMKSARLIQNKLLSLAEVYSLSGYSVYIGVKRVLANMGIIGRDVLSPFNDVDNPRLAELDRALEKLAIA